MYKFEYERKINKDWERNVYLRVQDFRCSIHKMKGFVTQKMFLLETQSMSSNNVIEDNFVNIFEHGIKQIYKNFKIKNCLF